MADFSWALEQMANGRAVRRKSWEPGIFAGFVDPKKENHPPKYAKESGGKPYLRTFHCAACELGGLRAKDDFLADDWTDDYD